MVETPQAFCRFQDGLTCRAGPVFEPGGHPATDNGTAWGQLSSRSGLLLGYLDQPATWVERRHASGTGLNIAAIVDIDDRPENVLGRPDKSPRARAKPKRRSVSSRRIRTASAAFSGSSNSSLSSGESGELSSSITTAVGSRPGSARSKSARRGSDSTTQSIAPRPKARPNQAAFAASATCSRRSGPLPTIRALHSQLFFDAERRRGGGRDKRWRSSATQRSGARRSGSASMDWPSPRWPSC